MKSDVSNVAKEGVEPQGESRRTKPRATRAVKKKEVNAAASTSGKSHKPGSADTPTAKKAEVATRRVRKAPAKSKTAKPVGEAGSGDLVNVRRRQGRAVATRKAILDAALIEFASLGFEGATTRTIAERANVPHGLVIYHFDNKLGIWQAVIEAAFNELHSRFVTLSAELAGSDPEFMLKSFYRDFIMTSAQRPELGWIFSHEVAARSDRLHWLLERIRGEDLSLTLDLIKQLQDKGRFVAGDPAHLHYIFIGAASRVFALAPEIEHHVGVSPFDPAFVAQHVALCHSLFFKDI